MTTTERVKKGMSGYVPGRLPSYSLRRLKLRVEEDYTAALMHEIRSAIALDPDVQVWLKGHRERRNTGLIEISIDGSAFCPWVVIIARADADNNLRLRYVERVTIHWYHSSDSFDGTGLWLSLANDILDAAVDDAQEIYCLLTQEETL